MAIPLYMRIALVINRCDNCMRDSYGIYNHDTKKVDKKSVSLGDSSELMNDPLLWGIITRKTQRSELVTGFMLFVHYNFGITESMVYKWTIVFK